MAKLELGGKRQCQNCGTKFFDLNRSPIVCPKCGTTFQVAALPRSTAARASQSEEESDTDTMPAEMVPLEEADAANEKAQPAAKAPPADEDIEIEDDSSDEAFLEEEEEDNDDVSDLIDGDIDEDEES